jgi:tRNA dimethylallyltransferase
MNSGTVLIAGPTASGKSRLALDLADSLGRGSTRIINADSMQVYAELSVLTARPTPEDEARVPHRLYGVLSVREECSAGRWRTLALAEIADAHAAGVVPIVVGGTGLYFRALLEGLAPVPEIPGDIRAEARARVGEVGPEALHAELSAADPTSVEGINVSDTQRLVRAWEVLAATGETLHAWQQRTTEPGGFAGAVAKVLLVPEREALYAAIGARVSGMVEKGALDEADRLERMALSVALPAARAVGVREFRAAARGDIGVEEAVAGAQQASRLYAKRQTTWFRHQAAGWTRFEASSGAQLSESFQEGVIPFIREFCLTLSG